MDESKQTSKAKTTGKTKQAEPSLNLDELRELADLVNENGFTDFEFENANIRVRLSKNTSVPMMQTVQPYQNLPMQAQTLPQGSASNTDADSPAEAQKDSDASLHKITSPIVGTFYRSSAPDKAPYVEEGSQVNSSTIVCIVEAMKLMNEIEAEVTGEIVKIYVENEQPVEYGQPLFGVRI